MGFPRYFAFLLTSAVAKQRSIKKGMKHTQTLCPDIPELVRHRTIPLTVQSQEVQTE